MAASRSGLASFGAHAVAATVNTDPDGERIETYTGTAITIVNTLRTLALEGHPLDSLIQRTSEITPA